VYGWYGGGEGTQPTSDSLSRREAFSVATSST